MFGVLASCYAELSNCCSQSAEKNEKIWLFFVFQIEDLSQQAQLAAAEKFKAPEASTAGGEGLASTLSQPIAEESEEEEDVSPILLSQLPFNRHFD